MLIQQLFTLSILIFHYWTVFHGPETTNKKEICSEFQNFVHQISINFCAAESNPSTFTAVHWGRRKLDALLQVHSPDITEEKLWTAKIEEENKSIKCDGKRRVTKPAGSYVGYFHSIWETNEKAFVIFLLFFLQYLSILVT